MATKSLEQLEREKATSMKVIADDGSTKVIPSVYGNEDVAKSVQAIMSERFRRISASVDDIRDYQWVTVNLFGDGYTLPPDAEARRFFSSADRKFQDTSLGGNYVCNPLPGITPYADPPKRGIGNRVMLSPMANLANIGMGAYYSQAFDDPSQILHIRCGKPEFNSSWGFFKTHYNVDAAALANTGRLGGALFTVGQVAAVGAMVFMLGGLLTFGLLAANYIAGGLHGILVSNPSKFYCMRPTMALYWNAVSQMVNQIMTHEGVFPSFDDQKVGEQVTYSKTLHDDLRALMPNVFGKSGFIDVYAIINRAERISIRVRKAQAAAIQASDTNAQLQAAMREADAFARSPDEYRSLDQALKLWQESEVGGRKKDGKGQETNTLAAGTLSERYQGDQLQADKPVPAFFDKPDEWIRDNLSKFKTYLDAEYQDGAAFATFRVDHTGPVQESFTNSTRSNDLGQKINAMSAQGRAVNFSFSNGNLLPGMDEIVGGIKNLTAGVLDIVNLGGLLTLAGSAYTDIPEGWENAVVNLPSMNYTIRLQPPNGHPISRMQFQTIPLCMLLALAMPHATGRSTYSMPFVMEVYDPGKAISRLCMCTSMQITRGVGNLGFLKNKAAMGIDVSMTFKDLSSIMYMPLDTSFSIDPFKSINSHDSAFTDYMAVLGAADLGSQVYRGQKLKLRAKNWIRGNIQNLTSMDQWAGMIRESSAFSWLDFRYPDTGRGL